MSYAKQTLIDAGWFDPVYMGEQKKRSATQGVTNETDRGQNKNDNESGSNLTKGVSNVK